TAAPGKKRGCAPQSTNAACFDVVALRRVNPAALCVAGRKEGRGWYVSSDGYCRTTEVPRNCAYALRRARGRGHYAGRRVRFDDLRAGGGDAYPAGGSPGTHGHAAGRWPRRAHWWGKCQRAGA